MVRLFEQLKRRNVLRAAAAYAVVAWLIIQVNDRQLTANRGRSLTIENSATSAGPVTFRDSFRTALVPP